jgi:predicted O-linked N-acetylglucosamine transferase (SPINDLY family)
LIDREDDFTNIENVTLELTQFLDQEANYQTINAQIEKAIQIRDCLYEINPYYLSNLLSIIVLFLNQQQSIRDKITDLDIFSLLDSTLFVPLDASQIKDFLESTIQSYAENEIFIQLVEQVCQCHPQHQPLIHETLRNIIDGLFGSSDKSIPLLSLGNRLYPQDIDFYINLSSDHTRKNNFTLALQVAQNFYRTAQSLNTVAKFMACQVLLGQILLNPSDWEQSVAINEEIHEHLHALLKEDFLQFSAREAALHMMIIGFYSPYFSDLPRENLLLRRAVREFATKSILADSNKEMMESIQKYRKRLLIRKQSYIPERPLRIGYISQYLRRHPIGFLTRSLIYHHNRDNFIIYGYLGHKYKKDILRNSYILLHFFQICWELADSLSPMAGPW